MSSAFAFQTENLDTTKLEDIIENHIKEKNEEWSDSPPVGESTHFPSTPNSVVSSVDSSYSSKCALESNTSSSSSSSSNNSNFTAKRKLHLEESGDTKRIKLTSVKPKNVILLS